MSVSILVPAFNEASTIEEVLCRCRAVLTAHCQDAEIVVLDDGSRDQTFAIAERFAQQNPGLVRVHRHATNLGIAATFEELYRLARKDLVLLVASDEQYPPEALPDCIARLPQADIVVCHRVHKPYGPFRHLVSLGYRLSIRVFFGLDLFDPGSIKLMRREIIDRTPIISRGVFAEAERVIRAVSSGYRLSKVEMAPVKRRAGVEHGVSLALIVGALADMCRVRWALWHQGRG